MAWTPKMSKIGRIYYYEEREDLLRVINFPTFRKVANEYEWEFQSADQADGFDTQEYLDSFETTTPCAIMSVNLVEIGNKHKDVIVALHRTKDLSDGFEDPFIVGRQSIINFLAAQFCTAVEQVPYGLCISRVTAPPDFNMNIMLEHERVLDSKVISLYPFDTIDTIQKLLGNTNDFDSVINNFRVNFDPKGTKAVGKTLYEFLDISGWQTEFNIAHGITVLDYEVFLYEDEEKYRTIHSPLSKIIYDAELLTDLLKRKLNHQVEVLEVTEYDPRHNLEKVDVRAFMLVRNFQNSQRVFIVKYKLGEPVVFIPKSQKLIASQLMSKLGYPDII